MLSPKAAIMKEWLQAYVNFEHFIDECYERLRYIETKISSAGAVEISDMPKSHGSSTDMLSEYLIRKEQIEERIQRGVDKQNMNRDQILDMMKYLSAQEEYIIKQRYIADLKWGVIMHNMYGAEPDYKLRNDTYARRVYRAHDCALEKMADNWTKRM